MIPQSSIVDGILASGQPESYQVDTSNVLFILSGAFVGLDKIVKRRITKGVGSVVLPTPPALTCCSRSVLGLQ